MTGSLQVKNNTFYIVLNQVEKGHRKQKWIPTGLQARGNRKKAEQLLNETLLKYREIGSFDSENATQEKAPSNESKDILFVDCIRNWYSVAQKKVEVGTFEGYYLVSEAQVIPYFEELGLRVSEITVNVLQTFFDYEYECGRKDGKGGLSASSLRQLKNIIKQSLDLAIKQEIISTNPCQNVDLPQKDRYHASFYGVPEIKRLFDAAKDDPLYDLIRITTLYGLRRSEALGLQWDCIDFETGRVTICRTVTKVTTEIEKDRTKNKSSYRSFALTPEARDIFLAMKKKEEENAKLFGSTYYVSQRVFKTDDGKPFSTSYVSKHFNALLRKNNLPPIRFHDLRHSCASLLLNDGMTLKDVQEYMGHSDIQMTANIYGHLDSSRKQLMSSQISGSIFH